MKRVGIFAGSFDPIHQGHLAFAIASAQVADLDKVIFLPEDKPRGKNTVASHAQRVEMLKLCAKNYSTLEVIEIGDEQFSVKETLPKIKKLFKGTKLYLLCGSDIEKSIAKWPAGKELLKTVEVIIGERGADAKKPRDKKHVCVYSGYSDTSSSKIREKLKKGEQILPDLPQPVREYIDKNKLYV